MVEGAPHTAKRSMINLCLWGAPSPVYKGVEEGDGRPSLWRALGSPTPTGSRIPPFHVVGVGVRKGKKEEKEGGGAAPPPSPIRTRP